MLTFGSSMMSFGSLMLTFGSLMLTFGSLMLTFGSSMMIWLLNYELVLSLSKYYELYQFEKRMRQKD
jgi:hypothetical protein